MKMVFIYGPPAVGKLTVAEEIAKKTGYKVFQNHKFNWAIADLFPYDDSRLSKIKVELTDKFRIELFSEAVKNGVNFITTYGNAGTKHFDFFDKLFSTVKNNGGVICLVHLIASQQALLDRVESESRKGVKIDNQNFLKDKFLTRQDIFDKYPGFEHLTIDNSSLSAADAASKIIEHYKIPGLSLE